MDGETSLLDRVKQNLIIDFSTDDALIQTFISAAISYAEGFQHVPAGYYGANPMSPATQQGIVMLASFFYESRDGASAGFFSSGNGSDAAVWNTVHLLLRLDREWKV